MFWFKKRQKQPGPPIPGKFSLSADVPLQTRRAQAVEKSLSEAILGVCRASQEIAACYLLDARKPNTEEIGLIIALTVSDEPHQMDQLAQRFQSMLREFPEQARKTVIMSSATFLAAYEGTEFYSR